MITAVGDREDAVDAVWAAAQLSWQAQDSGRPVDVGPVLDVVVPVLRGEPVG